MYVLSEYCSHKEWKRNLFSTALYLATTTKEKLFEMKSFFIHSKILLSRIFSSKKVETYKRHWKEFLIFFSSENTKCFTFWFIHWLGTLWIVNLASKMIDTHVLSRGIQNVYSCRSNDKTIFLPFVVHLLCSCLCHQNNHALILDFRFCTHVNQFQMHTWLLLTTHHKSTIQLANSLICQSVGCRRFYYR